MSSGKNVLETFRDVVQDLLVPELKAVKVSVDSLRTEMKINTEAFREELKLTKDALREEIRLNNEAVRQELKFRNESLERVISLELERNALVTQKLSEKLDFAIDIRERLAAVEARMPKQ